jgi:hypothetical protein
MARMSVAAPLSGEPVSTFDAQTSAMPASKTRGGLLIVSRRPGLQTALAWGWLEDASETLEKVDRLLALLWRLTHPRK